MNHGLNNSFLYSACRVISKFSNGASTVTSTGTGFFIIKESTTSFITNRHMVDIEYADFKKQFVGFKLCEFYIDNRRIDKNTQLPSDIIEYKVQNFSEFIFPNAKENDIACLKTIKVTNVNTSIEFAIPFEMLASEDKIKNKLSVCDFVAFPGFPDWYDKRNNTPILRTGALASDPRVDYSITKDFMGNCIAFEAFSYGGSSGSPVFAIQKGFPIGPGLSSGDDFYREILLIGINAGHFDTTSGQHSGISYLFKSSEIIELINKK
jgi:hypothetical protein